MTRISVITSWLCATGVTVISSYCILTAHPNKPEAQKRAAGVAASVSKHGTISEYKSKSRHSSAVKKTTTAKVTEVNVKLPTYIPNPIYPPFTNALQQLTEELADIAKDGEVELENAFRLVMKDGKPLLKFPEEYGRIGIGGVSMGDEVTCGCYGVCRRRIDGTEKEMVDGVGLSKRKRLDEPEFYCTDVTYSVLPATKQVDAIRMHGDLNIYSSPSKAEAMLKEISKWMEEDYGAVDQKAATPSGTLALKKFKIGKGMEVEVRVNWNRNGITEKGDAHIDIAFTTGELVEENRYQSQKLAQAADAARISTLNTTGVNYFSVRPTVNADAVKNKVVY